MVNFLDVKLGEQAMATLGGMAEHRFSNVNN